MPSLRGENLRLHPKPGEAIMLFLFVLLLCYTIGIILQRFGFSVLATVITEILFIGLPGLSFLYYYRSLAARPVFDFPRPRNLILVFLAGVLTAWGMAFFSHFVRDIIGTVSHSHSSTHRISDGINILGILLSLYSGWLLAPLCEELLFRVVIQRILSLYYPAWLSIISTSLLFALCHGFLERFPETFLMGLLLGLIYQRTGNYWLVVFFHAICNVIWSPVYVLTDSVSIPTQLGLFLLFLSPVVFLLPRKGKRKEGLEEDAPAWWGTDWRGVTGLLPAWRPAPMFAISAILVCGLATMTILHIHLTRGPFVAASIQEWHLTAEGDFIVTERVSLSDNRGLPHRMVGPNAGARLVAVKSDETEFAYERDSEGWILAEEQERNIGKMEVQWRVPLAELNLLAEDEMYMHDLKVAAPVHYLEVRLTLDDDCGFEVPGCPEEEHTTFQSKRSLWREPTDNFGRAGFHLREVGE